LSLTKAPVSATHSGIKGIVDVSRNLSDEELELIKKNGGVVQVVAFNNYLRPAPPQSGKQAKGSKVAEAAPATIGQLVDAIAYAVKKIGIDHVGIASDFDHGGGLDGWRDEGQAQNVTAELLRRGYYEVTLPSFGRQLLARLGRGSKGQEEVRSSMQRGVPLLL
jgi:membrane dipeptidase